MQTPGIITTTMKKKVPLKLSICLWFALLMIIFVTSCTISASPQTQVDVTVTMVTPAASTTPTAINQATTTATLIPTESSTPILATALPSPTQTPIPISSLIPTLSIEQQAMLEVRERLLQELMQNNGNCQLPCWWGIELGDSLATIEEKFADHEIGTQRAPSGITNSDEQVYVSLGYYNAATLGDDTSIIVNFHTINGVTQFINVLGERPLRQYGAEEFVRDWEKYALDSILQQYGKPAYVYLVPQNVADPGPPNFVLVLYYPDLGFTFSYQPFDTFSDETEAELCLALDNMRQIELSLYNPEYVGVWANYLLPPAINPEAEDYFERWEWEAKTGTDLDVFYEMFKYPDNYSQCILVVR